MGKCKHFFDHSGKCIKCDSRDIGGIEDMPDLKPITRSEWRERWDGCMACGHKPWRGNHHEVHEIAGGPGRKAAMKDPAAWLYLCRTCHRGFAGVHDYEIWPIARQLALKKKRDPEHYDRVKVNQLRGRADEAITEAEVDAYLDTV